MAVVLLILKILGITLLCLLGIVILALCLPAVVSVQYKDNRLTVWMRALWFVKIKLFPQKKRKKKQEKPKDEPKKEKPPTDKKKSSVDFGLIKQLLAPAGQTMKKVFSAIAIKNITLFWPVHSRDAAKTAIEYGRTCVFFNGIFALLSNSFKLTLKKITIEPDFDNKYEGKEEFSCDASAALVIMVIAVISLMLKYLQLQKSNSEENDGKRNRQSDGNDPKKSQRTA